MKTTGNFRSTDGRTDLYYAVWEPEGVKPVCVLQIIHGMCEYIDRYEPIAEYLNGFGIIVCGDDHLGHGHSVNDGKFGYFGEKDGWKHLVDDEQELRKLMEAKYPELPYVMLGHSMGSFIIRAYLNVYAEGLKGAVIEGTSGSNPGAAAGIAMASTIRKFKGSEHHSDMITNIAFGSYGKRIQNPRTKYDWISRDNAIVDKYVKDPFCMFTFTLAAYEDMFRLLQHVSTDEWYKNYPKDLPTLLAAGSEDPVGNYGKGVAEVCEKLQAQGCDVNLSIYEGMRHELHNEIGREAFYEELKDFVLECIEE